MSRLSPFIEAWTKGIACEILGRSIPSNAGFDMGKIAISVWESWYAPWRTALSNEFYEEAGETAINES